MENYDTIAANPAQEGPMALQPRPPMPVTDAATALVANIPKSKAFRTPASAKDAPKENGVLRWVLPKNLPASIVVLGDMEKTVRVPVLKRRARHVAEEHI